jgi:hypothetical protein
LFRFGVLATLGPSPNRLRKFLERFESERRSENATSFVNKTQASGVFSSNARQSTGLCQLPKILTAVMA